MICGQVDLISVSSPHILSSAYKTSLLCSSKKHWKENTSPVQFTVQIKQRKCVPLLPKTCYTDIPASSAVCAAIIRAHGP